MTKKSSSKIGPQQIKAAITMWQKAVPKSKQRKLAARAKMRKKKSAAKFDIWGDADLKEVAEFYGTTEGALKGWESRLRKQGITKKSPEEVNKSIQSGTVSKNDLHGLTVKKLIDVKNSLGIKHSGTKSSLVEKIHGQATNGKNVGVGKAAPTQRASESVDQGGARNAGDPIKDQSDIFIKAQGGDKKAIAEVVQKNQGLVGQIVNHYASSATERQDLMQEGNLGILRALKDYNPDKGSFTTHAMQWIRNYVGRAAKKAYKIERSPESAENPDVVDTKAAHPSQSVTSGEEHSQAHDMLSKLDSRSASLLKMRYGIGGGEPKTLEEAAKSMGISRQRAHQIETEAKKKLRSISAEFSAIVDKMEAEEFVALFGWDEEKHPRDSKGQFASIGDHLANGKVISAKRLGGGVNETHKVTLEGGRRGVFKTASANKEIMVSKLADQLGLADLVPTTVEREINGKIGSIQDHIGNGTTAFNVSNKFDGPEDLARAAAFDYLTGQVDRHDGNWMLTTKSASFFQRLSQRLSGTKQEGVKIKLIDNGETFPVKEQPGDLQNQDLLRQASSMKVPDLSSWKWSDIEKTLKGLDPQAISLAKSRFDALQSSAGKTFGSLTYAGANLGELFARTPQGFRVIK